MFLDIVEQLPIRFVTLNQTTGEYRAHCPFHADRNPSFSVNVETGQWICFTGCGAGTIHDLIDRLQGAGQAFKAIWPRKPKSRKALRSFVERGFTREILERWGITYDEHYQAMAIPILDEAGRLSGYSYRRKRGAKPKYLNTYGLDKPLFCAHKLNGHRGFYLVEGTLDAIWLWEAGIPAVSLLGTHLTNRQKECLQKLSPRLLILALDNDKDGRRATYELALKILPTLIPSTRLAWQPWPRGVKDAQDLPLSVLVAVAQRYMPIDMMKIVSRPEVIAYELPASHYNRRGTMDHT